MRNGAHAEYVCVREERLVTHMPIGMTFEEAAAVCDGFTQGLACLKAAGAGAATRLLVYGASGSCGTAAVQLAKHHVGAHVTAVCNTKNVELVRSLGADEVIDYLEDDFTKQGRTYDVVLDAVGKHSYFRSRRALEPHGFFVATDRLYNFPLAFLTRVAKKKVVFNVERPTRESILLAKELLEAGKYRPVVDRVYPLEDVIEATKYVDTFQKVGNVVLTVGGYSSADDTASSSVSSRPSA
jgi:NADPH:quinone reductase-like Zn-dependent oxidoreductase